MKKILFIVEAMGGGVFTYIVDLANELSKDNEVYIAYGIRPQTPKNYKEYFYNSVNLIEVKNFTREIKIKEDLKAFNEIRKIYKKIQPDIVHLHSSKAGILGRLAFIGKKTPIFYTPHGYSFLMKNQSKLKILFYKSMEYIFAKTKSVTIACSIGEYEEAVKFSKNAKVVNNGINVNQLEKNINSVKKELEFFEKKKKTVYTLGRISYQKNPELFNKIAMVLPDTDFLWIGDGELREKLTAPNIKITGWISRKEALRYAMQSDIFVLTSLWEGLPMSLLESMYLKKLCIVSDVVGNHDVIKSGINGYVCNTAEEFVNAINSLENEKLVDTAFEQISSELNTGVMASKYSKIYFENGE